MNRRLQQYQRDKIALERARREAVRTHVKPCDCPFCITPERVKVLIERSLARNASTTEPVPF